jgi:mannan endo-1,4-beta-mannosidase
MLFPLLTAIVGATIAPIHIECETGTVTGTASVSTAKAGYTGTGYVGDFTDNTAKLSMNFTIATAGVYKITLGYLAAGGKVADVSVDGKVVASPALANSATWSSVDATELLLPAGAHTLAITPNWTWFQMDWVDITPSSSLPPAKPTDGLSNANADIGAKRLQSWLVSQYGTHIVSGQTDSSEAAWIYAQTGKLPAVIAFDMMDYTPSRHRVGGTNPSTGTVEQAIRWGKSGGIVAYQWH